ncbi:NGB [Symbiodinium natans]|uniref:NGB protein n=1 Tax=Symbiodinium natans TaxID=878477 RepID=A0A812KP83_9DINO|nr:NGB [Symbiodinium natans]
MHQPRSLADRRFTPQIRETSPRSVRPPRQETTTLHTQGPRPMPTHSSIRGTLSSTVQPSRPRPAYVPPTRPTYTRGSRISNRVKAQNPVVCFLCDIGLPQYVDAMLRNGFDEMETLSDMREEHMKSMGILPGHALKLKKRLREFLGTEEVSPAPSLPREPEGFSVDTLSNDATMSIQQSWVEVRKLGVSTVGHTFYKHMFQLVPEARKLFPMTFQRHFGEDGLFQLNLQQAIESPPAPVLEHFTRVLEAIGTAVAGLQNKERLVPQLNALGYRHATLGLEEKYFRVGNAALMLTLHEALGSRFSTTLEESWTLVYGFMSANMITGFREFRAKEAQVGEFHEDLKRSLKKQEKKMAATPQPEKLRALAEKISGHLKKEDKPTLLTSQPKEPELSGKVEVCETPKVEETGLPEVAVA